MSKEKNTTQRPVSDLRLQSTSHFLKMLRQSNLAFYAEHGEDPEARRKAQKILAGERL